MNYPRRGGGGGGGRGRGRGRSISSSNCTSTGVSGDAGGGGNVRHFPGRGRSHGNNNNHNRGRNSGHRNNSTTSSEWHSRDFVETIEEIGLSNVNGTTTTTTTSPTNTIAIAVEGCCHGAMDPIYERLTNHIQQTGRTIDLLLCCGDFQSLRTPADFHSLAVPSKYRQMGDFYNYYAGTKVAPILTIFIGGNHEASQALQELYYGGWVAPNIYYLGVAGVVTYRGLRIAGMSGIYKSHDHLQSRWEIPPFDDRTMRSVYHYRNLDCYRLQCLNTSQRRLHIFLSHDWPQGIERHGNTKALVRRKPFFRNEIDANTLGSPPAWELMQILQPMYWFSAHLHVKFQATVVHGVGTVDPVAPEISMAESTPPALLVPSQALTASSSLIRSHQDNATDDLVEEDMMQLPKSTTTTQFIVPETSQMHPNAPRDLTEQMTQFLSLDKCLPRRQYLSIVHVPLQDEDIHSRPSDNKDNHKLHYDVEWLAILRRTHQLLAAKSKTRVIPPKEPYHVSDAEMDFIRQQLLSTHGSTQIPENFVTTLPPHIVSLSQQNVLPPPLPRMGNPQTDQLLALLQLDHLPNLTIPYTPFVSQHARSMVPEIHDDNEIALDDDVDIATDEIEPDRIDIDDEDENEINLGDVQDEADSTTTGPNDKKKQRLLYKE